MVPLTPHSPAPPPRNRRPHCVEIHCARQPFANFLVFVGCFAKDLGGRQLFDAFHQFLKRLKVDRQHVGAFAAHCVHVAQRLGRLPQLVVAAFVLAA
jgi:hypothetical protein